MSRHLRRAIEQTHCVVIGNEREVLPRVQRGHGISIGIEANECRLVYADGHNGEEFAGRDSRVRLRVARARESAEISARRTTSRITQGT